LNGRPDHPTVLVLGVGGNVSQGIMKALALSELEPRIVAACVTPRAAGLYWADAAYVSPYADDPEFEPWLLELCQRERVDAVLSGVEPVLGALAGCAATLERAGTLAVVSAPEKLEIGLDKLATASWLEREGLNAPATADAGDPEAVERLVEAHGLDLIAKPRLGKGSQGVFEITDREQLANARTRPGYVLQQRLGDADSEYTVACFSDLDGRVRGSIAMRRGLEQGTTVWAEVGEHPLARAEANRIAAALRPLGPCNVQLREHDGRAVCFEINVRFSGTTPIRARLGFNDVDATLRHYVLGEPAVDLPLITSGLALRYWTEEYVDPADEVQPR
jgi:carbamoyl-phosphate synthase large subunit